MAKEMYIASSPHETKIAVLEEEQLVEIYFERDTDVGMAGGIYKGRVNRVLPGMQSAFVDIGLERDAFLYVSDFFLEDQEEFDTLLDETESRVAAVTAEPHVDEPPQVAPPSEPIDGAQKREPASAPAITAPSDDIASAHHSEPADQRAESPAPSKSPVPSIAEPASAAPPAKFREEGSGHRSDRRGGRRRRRWSGSGEHRHSGPRSPEPPRDHAPSEAQSFEILPGESLAKHRRSEETPAFPAARTEAEQHRAAEAAPPAQAGSEVQAPSPAPSKLSSAPSIETPNRTAAVPHRGVREEPPSSAQDFEPPPVGETDAEPISSVAEPAMHVEKESAEQPFASEVQATLPQAGEAEEALAAEGQESPSPAAEAPTPDSEPREYTLRESNVQPRFAPRRGRRGRRRGGRHHGGRPAPNARPEATRSGNDQPVKISDLLKEGQEILVQIAKEPLGTKGARITSHIALPARYVVYMPTIKHIGISRRIGNEQERLRLRNIILENRGPLTGGFIVRTAGEGRSEAEFKADLKFLTALWNEIHTKAEQSKGPAIIYRDLDLVQRLLRDILTPDFKSIRVDSESVYSRVLDFVNDCQPSLVSHVKLHTRPVPLFEEYGIHAEIEKALRPKVWLKSGGYIVINQTEALVAIDVNTGKYVGKTNRLEDTILKTNIDAVNEIVRQIRLRDLGGIIVIDFIDMDERRNRNRVIQAMEEALRRDRAPTKLLSFNDFGLVAITRKRVKQSLERTLCDPCAYCNGSGWVKSVQTVCNEIFVEAQKMSKQVEGKTMNLRVNPEVAHALRAHGGALVTELEGLTGKEVVIKSDPTVHQERFEIF